LYPFCGGFPAVGQLLCGGFVVASQLDLSARLGELVANWLIGRLLVVKKQH